jgi:peptidoglycan/LPS O-acetylase OafA/YrhL
MRQARSAQPDPAGGASTLGTGRVGNVDVLRAVAALAVLVGHAYSLGGRSVPVKAQHWYDVPMITTATGVWLFFGISGYVISRPFVDRLLRDEPLPDVVSYAARRATRIFPLYWIALTAVIVIGSRDPTRGWQYPFHYLLLNNLVPGRQGALFSVAWTLTLEVLFYVAVPILAVAAKRLGAARSPERLAVVVIVSWVASIAFTVVGDLVGGGETGLWLRGSFPAMWQMFCPGILLAIVPHLRAAAWRRSLLELPAQRTGLYVMVGALLLGALIGSCAPLRFGVVGYQLIVDISRPLFAVGYGLLIAAAIRSRPWGRQGGWLLELGLISYGIYLLHAVILEFLLHHPALVPLKNTSLVAFAVHALLLVALTVPLAMLSWRWLERPLIDVGRRIGVQRSARRRQREVSNVGRPAWPAQAQD